MNSERNILKRLLEGVHEDPNDIKYSEEELDESGFESGGKVYKCAFGHYTCDGEPISREDYFKAKEGGNVSTGSSSKSEPNLEIPKVDYSDIEGAQTTKGGTLLFNDTKSALKYEKRVGNEIRKQNGITNDQEAEEFCNSLKNKIVSNAKETGKSVDKTSKEYRAMKAVASTLKGHTISGYGMSSAYTDIKKSSPYSFTSMTNEIEGKETKPKKTLAQMTGSRYGRQEDNGNFHSKTTKNRSMVDGPVEALKAGDLEGMTYGKSYTKSKGALEYDDIHTFTDENGNEGVIKVLTRGNPMQRTYSWHILKGDEAKKELSSEGYKEVSDK